MSIFYTQKQPAEVFPITVDFVNELSVGETIVTPVVTSKNSDTLVDTTTAICQGAPVATGSRVAQTIKAGASGERHLIQFRITTSASNIFEAEVQLAVDEV